MPSAVKLYRPANGTEGEAFMHAWCDTCEHERPFRENRGDACEVLRAALVHGVGDDEYPDEWRYHPSTGQPMCTRFAPKQELSEASIG